LITEKIIRFKKNCYGLRNFTQSRKESAKSPKIPLPLLQLLAPLREDFQGNIQKKRANHRLKTNISAYFRTRNNKNKNGTNPGA